jgi:hypothetical protein
MHYPVPPIRLGRDPGEHLSWFIRALNGLEPKERRELPSQILGASD